MGRTNDIDLERLGDVRYDELQMALVKVVAEQNHEKFLEYDCATDMAVMYLVSNGRFVVKEIIQDYVCKANMAFNRIVEEDRELYCKEFMRCLKKQSSTVFDVRYYDENGQENWHRVFLVSLVDKERKVYKLAARFMSIHKEKLAQNILRMQAERDSLSGVYNRKTYESMCADIIHKHYDGIMFLVLDIDDFKKINDTYGHHTGDKIVKRVGEALALSVQEKGIVGRLGGDEFSACIYNIWNKDDAIARCVRIKDAIRDIDEGVEFSVSIGVAKSAGRDMGFAELYYEADAALYYAKNQGKNQIIFTDELTANEEVRTEESLVRGIKSREEISLNQRFEYTIIVDPATDKILYLNEPARDFLGLTLEKAYELDYRELFRGCDMECSLSDLYSNHVHIFKEGEECGLHKYVPDGRFVLLSRFCNWNDIPARTISFLNMNDTTYVEEFLKEELETDIVLEHCWNVILESDALEVNYTYLLKTITEYYDADCSAIVTKIDDEYSEVFEYHKESAENIAKRLHNSTKGDILTQMEVLMDEQGYMRREHIEKVLLEYPELAKELEKALVHSTLGIKLARRDAFVGIFMVTNPRHHVDNWTIIERLSIFFTTDLLRKRLSDDYTYGITHDILTRLWNRTYYSQWLTRFGVTITKSFGVFLTDILHLSDVNRDFGYENGNRRLVEVADIYRKVFGGYSIFRYDDDQMLVVCHNTSRNDFQKMVNYARELFQEANFAISCGYAWTQEGEVPKLVREATDMLEKDRKRLESDNTTDSIAVKQIASDVISEIENGNFHVYLQPKVSMLSGNTVGAEALIRFYRQGHGFVSPVYFIPVLEDRGLVYLIDLFVLKEVFLFEKKAIEEGKHVVPISVNFSKNTLVYPELLECVKQMCGEYELPEGLIQIEITETITSMDHMEVQRIANALRSMGFSVSMDDFGTKYSNMAVLSQFEFDTVKIDRSLLLDVTSNEKNVKILKHILEMMRDLGVETVMEGVETEEEAAILQKLGCDTVQGYFYGRPEPIDKFYELFM